MKKDVQNSCCLPVRKRILRQPSIKQLNTMPLFGTTTRRVVAATGSTCRGLHLRQRQQQQHPRNNKWSSAPSSSAAFGSILCPVNNKQHSRFFTSTTTTTNNNKNNNDTSSTPEEDASPVSSCPLDYYSVLGVERGFSIDAKALQQSYRTLMTQHHPDLQHHNQSSNNNHDYASTITHAYHTLRKPHTRAMHLLRLVGKPIDGDDDEGRNHHRPDDKDETITDAASASRIPPAALVGPEFLMHMMEWREMIEAIPSLSDYGGSTGGTHDQNDDDDIDDKNNEVLQELKERLQETRQHMESILTQLDQVYGENEDLDHKAMSLVAQLQYWHRIEETIVEKM